MKNQFENNDFNFYLKENLKTLYSDKEAKNELKNFAKKELLEIAKELSITVLKSATKTKVIEQIIDGTVGVRLTNEAFKSKSEL